MSAVLPCCSSMQSNSQWGSPWRISGTESLPSTEKCCIPLFNLKFKKLATEFGGLVARNQHLRLKSWRRQRSLNSERWNQCHSWHSLRSLTGISIICRSNRTGLRAAAARSDGQQAAYELLDTGSNAAADRSKNLSEESDLLDDALFLKLSKVEDASIALSLIAETAASRGIEGRGVVSSKEAARIIEAALAEGNSALAFSILAATRSALLRRPSNQGTSGSNSGEQVRQWQWAAVEVGTYAALVCGLAQSLQVADAVRCVESVRRRGLPEGDEVPFGHVVDCPTCCRPLAVVQPQQGLQLVPCGNCRYCFELMSGDVAESKSEALIGNQSLLQRGLHLLRLRGQPVAAASHSLVVCSPDGVARTHRFGTPSSEIPAQQGERVTVASSAPSSAYRRGFLGLLPASTRTPGWAPGEPMAITNHVTGRMSQLVRAPPEVSSGGAIPSWLLPLGLVMASSDAASGLIDPALPSMLALGAASAVAVAGVANTFVLPRLNQLPSKALDLVEVRQRLLRRHKQLQARLDDLTQAASEEVRMYARMCQLQNKMEAVGEPSTYSARMERVSTAREGLAQRLVARLDLIDSYAKIASMIEIEVEMDSDLLAAEAAGAEANISEQIEKLMEVEALQKEWKIQAEASDEVERLLRNAPPLPYNAPSENLDT